MKKYVVLYLMLMCTPVFAAPSVHAVGSVATPVSVGTGTTKATPVRASSTKLPANTTSLSRIGSMRPSGKTAISGAITTSGSASRVPIIPVKSYSITSGSDSNSNKPQSSSEQSSGSCCNIDVDAIIQAIRQEFYDKTEVYNNNHFTNAVTDIVNGIVIEPFEDPKIDAVRIVNQANNKLPAEVWAEKGLSLPNDYVYIWIEE